jgi:signal transduction histidine kinase
MKDEIIPHDRIKSLEDKIEQLKKINIALMDRVERGTDNAGSSYSLFESNLTLQNMVKERTRHLRQAQTKLAQHDKMAALGKLVAGIAHEVNTPVGVIASSTDTIDRALATIEKALNEPGDRNSLLADNKIARSLDALKQNNRNNSKASARIAGIITSLKNFARLDQSELQQADLHEGLDSTLELLKHKLNGHITIKKEYAQLPRVTCCPGEINQAYLHLIQNAIEAIDKEGTITIKTGIRDNNAEVSIADTGRGITRMRLNDLFDFCFTCDTSRVKMGMGLMTCYNIMQGHGGEIRVQSELGKGSVFTISLPMEREEVKA